MNTSLLIVTFRRDFPYLKYCLRSISRFATGFHRLHILVPTGQGDEVQSMCVVEQINMPMVVSEYEEWPGKGMMHHMLKIMYADDYCFDADFIAHIDSDCVFTEAVTPNDYIKDGRPILRYERFENIGRRHPGATAWQAPTERCLPFAIPWETMRCHPGVHIREVYPEARLLIEDKTQKTLDQYLQSVGHTYPEQFCEFVTLGNVAMRCFPNRYHLVEQFSDQVQPDNKLIQTWSRARVDEPVNLWIRGKERMCSAMDIFREVGLT